MRTVFAAIALIVVVLAVSFYVAFIPDTINPSIEGSSVCIKDRCFTVELAVTAEQKTNGLMFRESLDQDSGMLFVYEPEAVHRVWMKNTLIPLDMIWINSKKEIIFIEHNAPPCVEAPCLGYGPDKTSFFVLEINGGLSKQHVFEVGDSVDIII